MDCHDVRLLLALTRRGGDTTDPTDRALVQEHLHACPDCAALARSEQLLDTALGTAMRAVPIPAGLQTRLLAQLALRRVPRWPRIAAAAAVLLLAIGAAGTAWALRPLPVVDLDVANQLINGQPRDPDEVKQWYRERGIEMEPLRTFEHAYLWSLEVMELDGRRVAKLVFFNPDRAAIAQVIVLPAHQFNTQELKEGNFLSTPNRVFIDPVSSSDFVYLIGTQNLDAFQSQPH
ncbi:MAG: hypothetical protein JOY66_10725 [Acetobacteraceae bacterium]|nr:hypothetical protein [Acetobacteraceae bacterium]